MYFYSNQQFAVWIILVVWISVVRRKWDLPFVTFATVWPLCVFGAAWSLLVWSHVESQVLPRLVRRRQGVIRSIFVLLLWSVLLDSLLFTHFRDAFLGSTCWVLRLSFRLKLLCCAVGRVDSLGNISRNCFWIQVIQARALLFVQFLVVSKPRLS